MTELSPAVLKKYLSNRTWRINNLYKIIDKYGQVRTLELNAMQKRVEQSKHPRKTCLKARQHGISTYACLAKSLDSALFNKNYNAAHICHREDDAKKFLAKKIMFAYEHLPSIIKQLIPVESVNASRVKFGNGSIIEVGTMVRGDTFNFLHVSEMGKLCSGQYAQKAQEVVAGALPTAEKGEILIESTAEGRYGWFFENCQEAQALQELGEPLSQKDFDFIFLPWFQNPDYVLDEKLRLTDAQAEYFHKIEGQTGVTLTEPQKVWYVKESKTLGDLMHQEHPSTPEEAFAATKDGTYFANLISDARKENRVCHLPPDQHKKLYASFDIGISDATAIWVFQVIGREIHFVDYYEMEGEALGHYMYKLDCISKDFQCTFEEVFLPHDAAAREKREGKSYVDGVREYGYEATVLKQAQNEITQIQDGRRMLPNCWFDKEKCKLGLKRLENFHKQYSNQYQVFLSKSAHDENSHGAKSFLYACAGVNRLLERGSIGYSADYWETLRQVG